MIFHWKARTLFAQRLIQRRQNINRTNQRTGETLIAREVHDYYIISTANTPHFIKGLLKRNAVFLGSLKI